MAENTMPTPPYIGFKPFWTFIEELRASGHAPQILDNTVLGANRSGAARSQLLVALRFLGLVDDERRKTDALDALVKTEDPVPAFGDLLLDRYGPVFDLSLPTATPAQVDAALSGMGAGTGETLKRSRQFFIRAAQFSGLEVGPFLAKGTPTAGASSRVTRKGRTRLRRSTAPAIGTVGTPSGDNYSVTLASGGTVTVTVSVNLWNLSKDDRDFVIGLIDSIKGYPTPDAFGEEPSSSSAKAGGVVSATVSTLP